MSVAVRPMTKADVNTVHEIDCVCFRSPWSKMALLGEFRNDVAHYHVAEADGRIAGYAGMWVLFEEAHITNLAVLPEFRRQGIAKEIMLSMMESALLFGATAMTLEVREHNEGAKNLYAQLGFLQNGFRPRYYSDTGEGALLLWNTDIRKTVEKERCN